MTEVALRNSNRDGRSMLASCRYGVQSHRVLISTRTDTDEASCRICWGEEEVNCPGKLPFCGGDEGWCGFVLPTLAYFVFMSGVTYPTGFRRGHSFNAMWMQRHLGARSPPLPLHVGSYHCRNQGPRSCAALRHLQGCLSTRRSSFVNTNIER